MLVATFGASTEWVGKTITYEDGEFVLEGHGPITGQDVVDYDQQGQIVWAYEGLRDWVRGLAAEAPTPEPSPPVGPVEAAERLEAKSSSGGNDLSADGSSVGELAHTLRHGRSEAEQEDAARRLAAIGSPEAVEALAAHVRHAKSAFLAVTAAGLLATCGEDGVRTLLELSTDSRTLPYVHEALRSVDDPAAQQRVAQLDELWQRKLAKSAEKEERAQARSKRWIWRWADRAAERAPGAACSNCGDCLIGALVLVALPAVGLTIVVSRRQRK